MRNAMVAVISFALGALMVWIVSNHRVHAQDDEGLLGLSIPYRPIVPPLGAVMPIPIVLRLSGNVFSRNRIRETAVRMVVGLDGLDASDNVYENAGGVKFVYGGGAYKLNNALIRGPVELELIGAAANTVQLLGLFGLLGPPQPQAEVAAPPPKKNTPIKKKTVLKNPLKGDIASQYDGTAR